MISVQMNDWRGVPITPGSIVVYPGRKSAHHWMMEAEVLEIIQVREWNSFKWALKVQPLRQGNYGRTNMKPVTLTAIERVTVVGHASEDLEKRHANLK